MKIEDNKIVIKKTIELMKKYNISKEVVSTAYPDIVWGDA